MKRNELMLDLSGFIESINNNRQSNSFTALILSERVVVKILTYFFCNLQLYTLSEQWLSLTVLLSKNQNIAENLVLPWNVFISAVFKTACQLTKPTPNTRTITLRSSGKINSLDQIKCMPGRRARSQQVIYQYSLNLSCFRPPHPVSFLSTPSNCFVDFSLVIRNFDLLLVLRCL